MAANENPIETTIKIPVVFIVGPTAVGKTSLADFLAQSFGGEVINADSRQVYRHLNIGTAKPTPEELSQAPHHLLDLLDPDENFDLATFLSLARSAMGDIHERGKLPIVAGGTGQYVWALLEGWQVPKVPPDPEFRAAKEREAQERGTEALFRQLREVDPKRAAQVDPRNLRRVIRALEIHRSGTPSEIDNEVERFPLENFLVIGLTLERQELYRRIDDRVDRMMDQGLEQEARFLAEKGYSLGSGPLSSPGYRELGLCFQGEITLEEAVQRTKFQTHRMARRQHAWFKGGDERINWLDAGSPDAHSLAAEIVRDFLESRAYYDTIGSIKGGISTNSETQQP